STVAVTGSCWFAGADDRRAGVLVDAVGLCDLDVGESGRGERSLELLTGEGACDAACPLPHVAPRRLVHVGVGDHVGDGEPAAGPRSSTVSPSCRSATAVGTPQPSDASSAAAGAPAASAPS